MCRSTRRVDSGPLGGTNSRYDQFEYRVSIFADSLVDVVVSGGEPIANDACVTTLGTSQQLMGTFIYSIGLDFIVMVLSAYKLLVQAHDFPRSRLVRLIFQDGLIYFIIVYVV